MAQSDGKGLRERATRVQQVIREVLFDEWDPIGVSDYAPRDEYDAYIGGVYHLLATGTSAGELAAHLRKLEIEPMECPTSPEHRQKIAERLLGLEIFLEEHYKSAHGPQASGPGR